MVRDILSFVDDADKGASFLQQLLMIAQEMGAHSKIGVLTAAPLMLPALAPYSSLYLPEIVLRADGEAQIGKVRGLVAHAADRTEVWGFHDSIGWLAADVRDSRQIADLIVIAAGDSWSAPWLRRRLAETLLLGGGTPILLLPPDPIFTKVEHAVLGWKPSAQSTRVLHDLVALAAPGARIDVLTIGGEPEPDPSSDPPGSGVRDHLVRHGFAVEMHRCDDGGEIIDQLQAFALHQRADLLAIGGFAHMRITEVMLGGITRTAIDLPCLPILMAH